MSLGDFQFSADSAALQTLQRNASHKWQQQERFGRGPALQFTGSAAETVELAGVVYPFHRGGLGQIDRLRALAAGGKPLALVSGAGAVLGQFVIASVDESGSELTFAGAAQKIEFRLSLVRYDNDTATQFTPAKAAERKYVSFSEQLKSNPAKEAQIRTTGYPMRLDELVKQAYGEVSGKIMAEVYKINPGLADLGVRLPAASAIKLPTYKSSSKVAAVVRLWS